MRFRRDDTNGPEAEGTKHPFNGRPMGDIADPHFAELMLATFIRAVPPTPRLKHSVLKLRHHRIGIRGDDRNVPVTVLRPAI